MAAPFGRGMRAAFPLEPGAIYLNHGTVGVTPNRVRDAHRAILDAIERHPSRFLLRELTGVTFGTKTRDVPRLREAADEVGAFLGARGQDLVFVDNTTAGANAVLKSFPFERGDEILVTDLGYGGLLNSAAFTARTHGLGVRTAVMPYPVATPHALTDAILAAVTPRTRLAIVDHISAQSALVFPIAEIAAALRARGVAVLADGAHVPGALPLDIASLGVDWYVANLHKWMWTPRSSGILWTSPARQADLRPLVTSWGLDQGMTMEFDLAGTRDPACHLAAPAAIAYMRELGVEAVQRYNHDLAWQAGRHLAERWGTEFVTPESMIGTMATVPLPASAGATQDDAVALRDRLLFDHAIELQVHAFRGRVYARVSAQIYNDMQDIDALAAAID
jgi:isopenicillin-N epimerase